MPSRLFALIAMLCLPAALYAQSESPARFQVFGGYSFLSNSLNGVPGSEHPLNGWDADMAFPSWHRLRFKLDVSGYIGSNLGLPQRPYFILGGAQYTWRIRRESVFVEGLGGVGGANRTWAGNGALGQTASFASLLGGGLDSRIKEHLVFRVEGGYQYSYFVLGHPVSLIPYGVPGLPTNFERISSGLVWEF
jgi:hypothetical protein